MWWTIIFYLLNRKQFQSTADKIKTKITSINSPFDNCWFLINSDGMDKCQKRYSYKGDILTGIAQYIQMVKHIKGKMNEDSNRRQQKIRK